MASGLQVWSKTPASNANADTNINWAEGQAPSSVNDSARSMMASMANWRDDNSGVLVTSGTTTAYTVQTNQVASALTSGYTVTVQFHATNDSSATLAPDGLAAKPMQLVPGVNLFGQEFRAGSVQQFTYSSTGTGQWIAWGAMAIPYVTNATTADITISTTSFTDGPSVSVTTSTAGVPGIWYVAANATVIPATPNTSIVLRLWDGTTTIASQGLTIANASYWTPVAMSGVIVAPVGNLRLSAHSVGAHTFTLESSASVSMDGPAVCSITAVRIG